MLQASAGQTAMNTPCISSIRDAVEVVFKLRQGVTNDTAGLYKVHIYEDKPTAKSIKESKTNLMASSVSPSAHKGRSVGYWCFSAGLTMREIVNNNVRNIILASGTLSPMDSWSAGTHPVFHKCVCGTKRTDDLIVHGPKRCKSLSTWFLGTKLHISQMCLL